MATPTKAIVEKVLRDYPRTRSSDKELFAHAALEFGLELSKAQIDKLMAMPSLETLTRVRRKIQEEGKYPASEEVRRHRKFKSMQVQQRMPQTKSDKVDDLINSREQTGLFGSFKRPFSQN